MQCWLHCKFRRLIITRESPCINSYSIYLLLLDYLYNIISPTELKMQPTIHLDGKVGYLPRPYPALRSDFFF
jgi:hypothetical protein